MASHHKIATRREKVFYLRVEEGKSYREIAREIDVSRQTVLEDLRAIFTAKEGEMRQERLMEIHRQSSVLDELLERWLPLAKSEELQVSETKVNRQGEEYHVTLPVWESAGTATDKVIKILERKSKLLGIEESQKKDTPEEIGRGLAMGVLQAMQAAARPPVKAEVIEHYDTTTDTGNAEGSSQQSQDAARLPDSNSD